MSFPPAAKSGLRVWEAGERGAERTLNNGFASGDYPRCNLSGVSACPRGTRSRSADSGSFLTPARLVHLRLHPTDLTPPLISCSRSSV